MSYKIQIIQPILTSYRMKLFNKLAYNSKYTLIINYSKKSPFGNSIKPNSQNKNIEYKMSGRWLNLFNFLYWQTQIKIDKRLKKGDIVIFCGSLRHLSIVPLIINAKLKSLKIVWWSHGRSIRPAPFFDKIRRFIMKYMDSIILYTEEEYRAYITYGFKKDIVFFINNTIDESEIINTKKKWDKNKLNDFRKSLNLPENSFISLFCGRLRSIPSTSLDIGIYAFNELLKKENNAYFLIIGNGEKLDTYKRIVSDLEIQKNVLFLGEEYSEEKLAPYFLISDIFLYPGYIGLSVVHSLWYNLPVVTHDNTLRHAPEFTVLKNNFNSVKFKEYDYIDLSLKLINLAKNKDQVKLMKERALNSVMGNWTFQQMVSNYDSAIYKILSK